MHQKRVASGQGKQPRFITVPNPGAHPKRESIPLVTLVRDVLGHADTAREARRIIRDGHVLVNGKTRREPKYAVGLMDIADIPELKKSFRILPSKKGLYPKEIDDKEAGTRLCRIVNKSVLPKGKIQLNLHDGTGILLDKDEYRRKDTLMIDVKTGKVKDSIEFKEGNTALVVHGRHSGEVGKIDEILPGTMKRESLTRVGELQTLTKYLFVIGRDKALISI